ncbi:MAG: hypothetical protein V3U23_08600, partial [Kiloniellales bacterium]
MLVNHAPGPATVVRTLHARAPGRSGGVYRALVRDHGVHVEHLALGQKVPDPAPAGRHHELAASGGGSRVLERPVEQAARHHGRA